MYTYETVTEAVSGLRSRGFREDFNLAEDCLICNTEKFREDQFRITETYRFEGDTDPADEAVVYGIESNNGIKGVLVNSYGYQSDSMSDAIARKLAQQH